MNRDNRRAAALTEKAKNKELNEYDRSFLTWYNKQKAKRELDKQAQKDKPEPEENIPLPGTATKEQMDAMVNAGLLPSDPKKAQEYINSSIADGGIGLLTGIASNAAASIGQKIGEISEAKQKQQEQALRQQEVKDLQETYNNSLKLAEFDAQTGDSSLFPGQIPSDVSGIIKDKMTVDLLRENTKAQQTYQEQIMAGKSESDALAEARKDLNLKQQLSLTDDKNIRNKLTEETKKAKEDIKNISTATRGVSRESLAMSGIDTKINAIEEIQNTRTYLQNRISAAESQIREIDKAEKDSGFLGSVGRGLMGFTRELGAMIDPSQSLLSQNEQYKKMAQAEIEAAKAALDKISTSGSSQQTLNDSKKQLTDMVMDKKYAQIAEQEQQIADTTSRGLATGAAIAAGIATGGGSIGATILADTLIGAATTSAAELSLVGAGRQTTEQATKNIASDTAINIIAGGVIGKFGSLIGRKLFGKAAGAADNAMTAGTKASDAAKGVKIYEGADEVGTIATDTFTDLSRRARAGENVTLRNPALYRQAEETVAATATKPTNKAAELLDPMALQRQGYEAAEEATRAQSFFTKPEMTIDEAKITITDQEQIQRQIKNPSKPKPDADIVPRPSVRLGSGASQELADRLTARQQAVTDRLATYASSDEAAQRLRQNGAFGVRSISVADTLSVRNVGADGVRSAGVVAAYDPSTESIIITRRAMGSQHVDATLDHEIGHGFQQATVGGLISNGIKGQIPYEQKLMQELGGDINNFLADPNGYKALRELLSQDDTIGGLYSPNRLQKEPVEIFPALLQASNASAFNSNPQAVEMFRKLMKFHGYANGGMVYANNGALIGARRGTDTVPAMLTPGEFVVNRQAAQTHMPVLQAINSGYMDRGGIVNYLASGGIVAPRYYQNGGGVSNTRVGGGVAQNYGDVEALLSSFQETMTETINNMQEGLNSAFSYYNESTNQLVQSIGSFGSSTAGFSESVNNIPNSIQTQMQATVQNHVTGIGAVEQNILGQAEQNSHIIAESKVSNLEYEQGRASEGTLFTS